MRASVFILILVFTLPAFAQNKGVPDQFTTTPGRRPVSHTVFGEILGNAGYGFYSINYDCLLPIKNIGGISFRAGASLNYSALICPVLVNFVAGGGNHHVELGVGTILGRSLKATVPGFYPVPTGNLSYRFQKPDGGTFFKIGYTPVFYDINQPNAGILVIFRYWVGLGIGGTF